MNKCYKSNTIARFLHNIAIKEDTWPVVVIPWQRDTMENGHWVCSKHWKKLFCFFSWELAVAWHPSQCCVYLLIAPQGRFTRWEWGNLAAKNPPRTTRVTPVAKTKSLSPSQNPFKQILNNRQSALRPDMKLRPVLSLVMDYIVKSW